MLSSWAQPCDDGRVVFTLGDRDRVRERVLDLASTDLRVVAGAAVGSLAHDQGDQWSDLDLMFAVAEDVPLTTVLEDWSQTVVRELDLRSGPIIYRVFLFPACLELDLSFTPAAEFSGRGPTFRLLFGEAHEQADEPPTPAQELLGYGVHHALHARVAIERGRHWQAEYWVSAIRDKALHLACRRQGLDGWYGRDFDKLPPEVLDRFNDALVRSLRPEELRRALAVAVAVLLRESGEAAELAERVRGQLHELATSVTL